MSKKRSRIVTDLDSEDYDDLPTAHQTSWYKCGHCSNLHLILRDEGGEAFATANLDEEMLLDMLRTIAEGHA